MVLLASVVGCEPRSKAKKIDFLSFSIVVPPDWKADTITNSMETASGARINIDFGIYAPKFDESVILVPLSEYKLHDSLTRESVIFSEDVAIDRIQGTFLKSYYFYDTINDKKAKVMVPKHIGHGSIGISFREIDSQRNHISIFTKDLDTLEHFKFLEMIQTISF